ncbi:MAG: imelysin family protein [Kofleriaceae bacterium]
MKQVLTVFVVVAAACGGDDDGGGTLEDARPVIATYATNVHANYVDTLEGAIALQAAVETLIATPNETTLQAARTAWIAAREPYGLTESYRFYDGPIDNPTDGPEGQINAWPLDEVYIDYVVRDPAAGLVNDTSVTLTKDLLASRNEQGGEKNISTGYHAIEFLLWGQDLSPTGPGARPATDYATADNADRRKQYLALVTELLVDDLTTVRDAWVPNTGYAAELVAAMPAEAVRRMIQGMGALGGAELSGERMATALDNQDQEDEHSCFSDNTHRDLRANAIAVQNVYLGRYGATDGVGIEDLVKSRDPALATRLAAELAASVALIESIQAPFDQALLDDQEREKIEDAVSALQKQTDTIVEVATLLGITLNL